MPIFYPTIDVRGVCDITLELLGRLGVRALILDVDNTLTTHDNPVPSQGVREWLAKMRQAGIPMMIVSNNHYERVKPFGPIAGPPLCRGRQEALIQWDEPCGPVYGGLPAGDRCWWGIKSLPISWGGTCLGQRPSSIQPIELEDKPFFKCKRFWKKGAPRYQRRKTR